MPDADDLTMRIYAAMAQKERELIIGPTKAALAAAKTRGQVLGVFAPPSGLCGVAVRP